MKHVLVFFLFLFTLNSCWTIHFTKGDFPPQDYEFSQWHHTGIAGLIEYSPSVNIEEVCFETKGNWEAVKTQTGFIQNLARILTGLGFWWTPQEVSLQCGEFYSLKEN
ncbi:MAG: hypothetical protein GDA46_00925 [Bdellovibrionales bacterium]|nr:hypothetical protein [Bdellovibrionales bacterium]